MRFEEVLPALRAGRKVRQASWPTHVRSYPSSFQAGLLWEQIEADDWEVVPELVRVADYWVPWNDGTLAAKLTFEIGKQPADAVLIPGSEREVTE
jgi:hypothetical protein